MQTQEEFVLDCSIAMALCFDDEATPYADGVRDSLADKRAVVPSVWPARSRKRHHLGPTHTASGWTRPAPGASS
jgi:hypothetical protein